MTTSANQINEILTANNITNYFVREGKRAAVWFAKYANQNAGYSVGKSDALWQIRLQSVSAYNQIASLIGYTKYNF